MSKLAISDLSFLTELDSHEEKIAGGAAAGAAAGAGGGDAVAGSAATDDGDVSANANSGFDGYYSSSGPSVNVSARDRFFYRY